LSGAAEPVGLTALHYSRGAMWLDDRRPDRRNLFLGFSVEISAAPRALA
jgi:hypothetical protein